MSVADSSFLLNHTSSTPEQNFFIDYKAGQANKGSVSVYQKRPPKQAPLESDASFNFSNVSISNQEQLSARKRIEDEGLTFQQKLLKEIKFSLDIRNHPIRQIIEEIQRLILEQIKHFRECLVEYEKQLQPHDLRINNLVY